MLDVYITVDTEIWCNGWNDLDAKFPDAFRRYVYGSTSRGQYAMPLILKLLNDYGLTGVFYTEPLFSLRFGQAPLQELIGLINEANQEIQLHLHTEWLDEAPKALFPYQGKRQYLYEFNQEEQVVLLEIGQRLLLEAGAGQPIKAFRAGNFGANRDSLKAMRRAGIFVDSSYNPGASHKMAAFQVDSMYQQVVELDGVLEHPVSVLDDGRGLRHVQLNACSWGELKHCLNQAEAEGWESAVIFLHNFELLSRAKDRPDPVATRRFTKLCDYLDCHRDRFCSQGYNNGEPRVFPGDAKPLPSNLMRTAWRYVEQASRRVLIPSNSER